MSKEVTRRQIKSQNHENIKEEINNVLASSLKELQIEKQIQRESMDANSTTLGGENLFTQKLLCVVEAAFIHGLKATNFEKRKNGKDLPMPHIWSLLTKISHKNIVQQINKLNQIRSLVGKSRAWIRMSLNEGDFSSYVYTLVTNEQNKSLLKRHYEPYALFLDYEQADIFCRRIQLTADLDFEIGANSSLLNSWTKSPLELSGTITSNLLSPLANKLGGFKTSSESLFEPSLYRSHSNAGSDNITTLRKTHGSLLSLQIPLSSSPNESSQRNSSLLHSASSLAMINGCSKIDGGEGLIEVEVGTTPSSLTSKEEQEDKILHRRHLYRKNKRTNKHTAGDNVSIRSWGSVSSLNSNMSICSVPTHPSRRGMKLTSSIKNESTTTTSSSTTSSPNSSPQNPNEVIDHVFSTATKESEEEKGDDDDETKQQPQELDDENSEGISDDSTTENLTTISPLPDEDEDSCSHDSSLNTDQQTTSHILLACEKKREDDLNEMIRSTSTITSDKFCQSSGIESSCTVTTLKVESTTDEEDGGDEDPFAVDIYANNSDGESEVEVLSSEVERMDSPENQLSSTGYGNSLLCGVGWSSEHQSPSSNHHHRDSIVTSPPQSSPPSPPREPEVIKCREGFLQKRGEGILFWKTRWFVLDSRFLRYYKDEKMKDGTALGEINFFELQHIDTSQLNKNRVITLQMSDGTLHHLTSQDKETLIDWLDDMERMSVKAKSAQYNSEQDDNSEDEFVVIDNLDAMRIHEDNNLLADRRMLIGGDELLSHMTKIANEKGLDLQNYQCATCSTPIGIIYESPRICMFTANYYCSGCHVNDEILIPARIIHNWDFRKHRVSKSSKDFMMRNWRLPCINLNHVNPAIYHHLEELRNLLKLRNRLVMLDPYFKTCRFIKREKLDRLLLGHHHMLDSAHMYTAYDLTLIPNGNLVKVVKNVVDFGVQHVTSCTLCSAKGFICEICNNEEVIFSFDDERTYQCDGCHGLFHKKCFSLPSQCPRCKRRNARFNKSSSQAPGDENDVDDDEDDYDDDS